MHKKSPCLTKSFPREAICCHRGLGISRAFFAVRLSGPASGLVPVDKSTLEMKTEEGGEIYSPGLKIPQDAPVRPSSQPAHPTAVWRRVCRSFFGESSVLFRPKEVKLCKSSQECPVAYKSTAMCLLTITGKPLWFARRGRGLRNCELPSLCFDKSLLSSCWRDATHASRDKPGKKMCHGANPSQCSLAPLAVQKPAWPSPSCGALGRRAREEGCSLPMALSKPLRPHGFWTNGKFFLKNFYSGLSSFTAPTHKMIPYNQLKQGTFSSKLFKKGSMFTADRM